MRTEVLQPPPPKRLRTVVLRAGPPQGRRPLWDGIIGAIGIVLLVLASVMVVTLPEPDVFMPQFEVRSVEERVNVTFDGSRNTAFELTESAPEVTIEVDIPVDNVNNILVDVGFEEDYPESRPDVFEVRLEDALGRPVNTPSTVQNGEPEYDENALGFPATRGDARINYGIGLRPEQEFVTGTRADVTEDDVRQLYLSDFHIPTQGTWKLRIRLVDAGDCPTPIEPDVDPMRISLCRSRDPNGQDTGNQITIEAFQYTYFDVQVSRL